MAGSITLIIVLIIAAMILFMLEILTPVFGLLVVLAVAALGTAVWQGFVLSPALGWPLLIALVFLTPIYLIALVKYLPRTPRGGRVFLKNAKTDANAGGGAPESGCHEALVGRNGVTETPLRPSGAIRIDQQRVIALAESGMIDKGRTVKVVRATAANVIVRETEPSS